MPELTQDEIDRLQDGEEIVVEIEVWHGDDEYKTTEEVPLVKAEGDADE